jgi:hypothetical protein
MAHCEGDITVVDPDEGVALDGDVEGLIAGAAKVAPAAINAATIGMTTA